MKKNKSINAINKDFRPLCIVNNKLLVYHREKLFLVNTITDEASFLCDFNIKDPRRIMCFCKFGERLSHLAAYCGIGINKEEAVVAFNRGIYKVNVLNGKVNKEFDFRLNDMRRPLNFYRIEGVKGFKNSILCPEYSFNKSHNAVNIYARTSDGSWDTVYTFPAGSIRHIHSIINDPFRERVIILTGDFGDECAIWEVKDNWKVVKKVIGSLQKYRACCARAYPEGIVIVTDSPFNQNYVYIVNEVGEEITIKPIFETMGPTVFFTYYDKNIVFATDVEYDESKIKGFIQYFSYTRGKGVKDWYSHMYIGNPNDGFKEVRKFKKDIWPMVTLGFGTIVFPNGQVDGKIYYYPMAVWKYNRRLSELRVE